MKRLILIYMILLLSAGALVGCGRKEPPAETPAQSSHAAETAVRPTRRAGIDVYDYTDLPETAGADETASEPETEPTQPESTAPPETEDPGHYTDASGPVWALENVRVRAAASSDGEVLGTLKKGRKTERTAVGDHGWTRVSWKGHTAYISSAYLTAREPETESPTEPPTGPETQAPIVKDVTGAGVVVDDMKAAQTASQIILVTAQAASEDCTVSMHEKQKDGSWKMLFETPGKMGPNGLYKEKEGDMKTPVGSFGIVMAFGRNDDPGCRLPYTKLTDSMHWIDDPESPHYNSFVDLSEGTVTPDWNSSEHLIETVPGYNYVLALDYNWPARTPYKGSAIFLHCFNAWRGSTHGCVAIDEAVMKTVMQRVKKGCRVVIGEPGRVSGY